MTKTTRKFSVVPTLTYKDADAALDFLSRAFGFKEHAVYRDEAGKVVHAELIFGNGMIMIGPDPGGEFGQMVMTLPERAGGRCTQAIYVIVDDTDVHHAHAKSAGAEILMPPREESTAVETTPRAIRKGMRGASGPTTLLLRSQAERVDCTHDVQSFARCGG